MKELMQALREENDIGKVIKAHITIESIIHDFVSRTAPNEARIKEMGLDYFGTVSLAGVLGLPDKFIAPLRCLGKLRNRFAHRLDQGLGKNEIDALYKTFPAEEKEKINSIVKKYFQDAETKEINFSKLPIGGKFAVLCVHLYGTLEIETLEIIQENKLKDVSREIQVQRDTAAKLAKLIEST